MRGCFTRLVKEPSPMISRRKAIVLSSALVGGSAVVGAVPALLSGSSASDRSRSAVGRRVALAGATASTLDIALVNATSSGDVYAYFTGLDINNGNALFLLQSDGRTAYHPGSPGSAGAALGQDCGIRLGAPGSTTTVSVPQLAGARVWFSVGQPLTFLLNPGPVLAQPSVGDPSDPNYNVTWDFCEFTFNSSQLYANLSYVDFVCLPIALTLAETNGNTQYIKGLPTNGLDLVCSGLSAQNAADGVGWDRLIVASGGENLRALSPTNGMMLDPSLFQGYFEPYVSQVWSHYSSNTLTVDTQASWGTVTGQVAGGALVFGGVGSFAPPATVDIFNCGTGPFDVGNNEMGVLVARISAALNRSTLLANPNQPDGENPADYYAGSITNHYARIVHSANLDGLGYAFPYDDVTPPGGVNQGGAVAAADPALLTITVGGAGGAQSPAPNQGRAAQTSEAQQTGGSSPSASTVSAFSRIQAAGHSSNNGTWYETCTDSGGGRDVAWIDNGCWLGYPGIDFGSAGASQFIARVASGAASGISGLVQVALDSPSAAPLGSFAVANTGGWQSWQTVPANMSAVTGVHTVYLVFSSGQQDDFVNVNWFTFAS
jgi:Beta-1,3-glucanase/Carbohydrate binding module (family 6)